MNTLFVTKYKLWSLCIGFLILAGCSPEKKKGIEPIEGTWQGEVWYTRSVEKKEFSELLKDSLTVLADSLYHMKDVTVDVGKQQVQFFGVKGIMPSRYQGYHWEEGKVLFEREPASEEAATGGRVPEGTIYKINRDSLVMNIRVYDTHHIDYLLKLKRK